MITSKSLTPCVGKCSTVFGYHVCRGCRRFNHEVIQWNQLSSQQQHNIWHRLDKQLDQIILQQMQLLPIMNIEYAKRYLFEKQWDIPNDASLGRVIYTLMRLVLRFPDCLPESGLDVSSIHQLRQVFDTTERQLIALAQAHYDMAWMRY